MEDTKEPNAPTESEGEGTPKRDEQATSSETLSDIEESEDVSTGGGGGSSSSDLEGSSPNPDAGGGGGRADGSDSGGPM